MTTSPNALAGALIFAWAAQDGEAFIAALRDVAEYSDHAAVIAALTASAADLLVQLHGERWPEALREALLAEAAQ